MEFFWPLKEIHITQAFGNKSSAYAMGYHMGIDLRASRRTPVYAAQSGLVAVAKTLAPFDGYGCHIALDHGNSIFSVYGHLDEVLVTINEIVVAGQLIGLSGGNPKDYQKPKSGYTKAGFSTAYHLHYELDKGAIGASHCINPTPITIFNPIYKMADQNFIPDWAKASVDKAHKKGLELPSPNTPPQKYEMAVYFDKLGLLDKLPDQK
ncbi:MAG: M23 family metallopeptidase [Bacteroidota bacterium]